MARPLKKGLDYHPTDLWMFDDEKFIDLQNKYGPLGEVIYIRILWLMYENGYYHKIESMEKTAARILKNIGSKWVRDKERVIKVISLLAESNLLDAKLMHDGILTSRGAQRRYLKVTGRRKRDNTEREYWLLDEKEESELLSEIDAADVFKNALKNIVSVDNNGVSVDNNPDNVGNNPTKQSKQKQTKLNLNKNESENKDKILSVPVEFVNNPSEIIAEVFFKSKGMNKRLYFTKQDAADINEIFPDVDIKIEAAEMQKWFDKPARQNVNMNSEQLRDYIIRWLTTAQNNSGNKPAENNDFNTDVFFRESAEFQDLKKREEKT